MKDILIITFKSKVVSFILLLTTIPRPVCKFFLRLSNFSCNTAIRSLASFSSDLYGSFVLARLAANGPKQASTN